MDELVKPSEANRVNFADMQSTSKKMLDDIRAIRLSLKTHFADVNDGYARRMFRFSAVAEEEMQELRDGILHAEKLLRDVQEYFGEEEEMGRPLQSQDFFGIFRTFTSSWKVSSEWRHKLTAVLPKPKSRSTGGSGYARKTGAGPRCPHPSTYRHLRGESRRHADATAQA